MPPCGPPVITPTVIFWPFQAGSGLPLSDAAKAASACFFSSSVYGTGVAAPAAGAVVAAGATVGAAAAAVVGAAAAGAEVGAAAAGAAVGAAAAGALVGAALGAGLLHAFRSGTTASVLPSTAASLRN